MCMHIICIYIYILYSYACIYTRVYVICLLKDSPARLRRLGVYWEQSQTTPEENLRKFGNFRMEDVVVVCTDLFAIVGRAAGLGGQPTECSFKGASACLQNTVLEGATRRNPLR